MELVAVPLDAEIDEKLPCCKHCDRPFKPRFERGRPQLHCSDACRLAYRRASGSESAAAWKYRNTESSREHRRLHKRRRHIKAASELRDPSFECLRIFARDGWRCQLCGQTVQDSRPTEMNSATIRLRVPIQLDGRYSVDNCETACRQCHGRAAALVARSLSDPGITLPRSLRWNEEYDAAPQVGPLSTSIESFGSVLAASGIAGPTLVPMSTQRPRTAPSARSRLNERVASHLAKNTTERASGPKKRLDVPYIAVRDNQLERLSAVRRRRLEGCDAL
jgi:5-methylcytosine-specific restriction endonuclease McrA